MNIFFHDAKTEANFLLEYMGCTVQITRASGSAVGGDPFDVVVHDAVTGGNGVELIYLPYDEDSGKPVVDAGPESINTEDIFELAIY